MPFSGLTQENVPKAALPVLTTSAGQSTDINVLNIILDQVGIKYDYCDVPTVKMINRGVGLGRGFRVMRVFHASYCI